MKQRITTALASAAGFVCGYFIPTLAFLLVYFFGMTESAKGRGPAPGGSMMVIYVAFAYALAGAIAYALVTALARDWCARPAKQVFAISVLTGVVAQILNWTGLSLGLLLPLMHVLPHKVATALGIALPGVVCGVAVLAWSLVRAERHGGPPAVKGD